MTEASPEIVVSGLDMGYDDFILMKNLNFTVKKGDIFIIMGGSGCGKSTLLKILIGLKEPLRGKVMYGDVNFWEARPERTGTYYEALWCSLPERGIVELYDPRRECSPSPRAIH